MKTERLLDLAQQLIELQEKIQNLISASSLNPDFHDEMRYRINQAIDEYIHVQITRWETHTMKQYLLKAEPDLFRAIDQARAKEHMTRADFIREACEMRLQYQRQVRDPFLDEMSERESSLTDPVAFFASNAADELTEIDELFS